jgi:predicted PurR-regulated permease PerM
MFSDEITGLKDLEPIVRDQLVSSISNATRRAAESIGKVLNQEANATVNKAADKLMDSVRAAQNSLSSYQSELTSNWWFWAGLSFMTSLLTSLVLVAFLMPKPTLPLIDQQIRWLHNGQTMEIIWPKLSKKEQQHWQALADQTRQP